MIYYAQNLYEEDIEDVDIGALDFDDFEEVEVKDYPGLSDTQNRERAASKFIEEQEREERGMTDDDSALVAVTEGEGQPIKIYRVYASLSWSYRAKEE